MNEPITPAQWVKAEMAAVAEVRIEYRLTCPHCAHDFKIGKPEKSAWVQRCPDCWEYFRVLG